MSPAAELLDEIPPPGGADADVASGEEAYARAREAFVHARDQENSHHDPLPRADSLSSWRRVADEARVALTTRSSRLHLRLATVYAEAMLRTEGLSGLRQGLELLHGMLERYWDVLEPAAQPDPADRAASLNVLSTREFHALVRRAPITGRGHSYVHYDGSKQVARREEVEEGTEKERRREALISEGWIAPEDWEAGVLEQPADRYREIVVDIDGSLRAVDAVDDIVRDKLESLDPKRRPDSRDLRSALTDVRVLVVKCLEAREAADASSRPAQAVAAAEAARPSEPFERPAIADAADPQLRADGSRPKGNVVPVESALRRAMTAARGGQRDRAIAIMMAELDREASRRGRFLRSADLAEVLVAIEKPEIAEPILHELRKQIETHRLEEWEAAPDVAKPLALLYLCLKQLQKDAPLAHALYETVCRLDPLRAIQPDMKP